MTKTRQNYHRSRPLRPTNDLVCPYASKSQLRDHQDCKKRNNMWVIDLAILRQPLMSQHSSMISSQLDLSHLSLINSPRLFISHAHTSELPFKTPFKFIFFHIYNTTKPINFTHIYSLCNDKTKLNKRWPGLFNIGTLYTRFSLKVCEISTSFLLTSYYQPFL